MSKTGQESGGKRVYREMTVALLREREEALEVAFSESARFYVLSRRHPEFARIAGLLREAKDKKKPVRVLLDDRTGNAIQDAQPL